jgi:Proline-rich nuclear receptor coactivator motif
MSTPQETTKAPRRSYRKLKPSATPNGAQPRGAVSDNELSHAQLETKGFQMNGDVPNGRRKSQASSRVGAANNVSVSDHPAPEKSKSTPIKQQAYAGPTFHQSPAASALPMPSFYSKSVPDAGAVRPPPQPIPEQHKEEPPRNIIREDTPSKRESTPLDFLFEAARQAQDTPRGQSPSARSAHLPIRNGSPAARSPAPKEPESIFPFELDGSTTPGEDGSSFATPYKDRIDAVKITRPASEGSSNMDENERRAKTDALKRLLMRSAGAHDSAGPELNNPFGARPLQSPNQLVPPQAQVRHRSGPSTPSYMQSYNGHGRGDQYFQHMPQLHFQNNDSYSHGGHRGSSNLRNVYGPASEPEPAELSSDSAISPLRISTARKPSYPISPPSTSSGQTFAAPAPNRAPSHRATPSVQQMEDDLRRVLKLDLTSQG